MSNNRISIILALLVPAAYGQTLAQPVREVDREARAAVRGTCTVSLSVGQSISPGALCTLDTLANVQLGNSVPSGTILVIEDASATCGRGSLDVVVSLGVTRVIQNPGSTGNLVTRAIPLVSHGTENGVNRLASFTSGRTYYAAFSRVGASLILASPATQAATCVLHLTGHLVDAQQWPM